MAIPKIKKQDIIDALKYIDENGVPFHNQSTKYELVTEDGKKYPPKYVVAVADHIANGADISIEGFNAVEAKNFLENQGFTIETKQEKFQLSVTAAGIESTDKRFTMGDLTLGNDYEPLDVYFKSAGGTIIKRICNKNEKQISNQTLPRLAFQVFEEQISALPKGERDGFPVCQYKPNDDLICGIYTTVEELKATLKTKSYGFSVYQNNDTQFVIYSWSIFSTIFFVQECLKKWGETGDQFVLIYREKTENEKKKGNTPPDNNGNLDTGYKNSYSEMLLKSKNLIFRGAPGTGKTHLAKEIAADIISNGSTKKYSDLSDEQKKQAGFVQFHPSYDYTDFVEGLRPITNGDSSMGFKLRDGVFMEFVKRARENFENSHKTKEIIAKEISVQESMTEFFSNIELGADTFKTVKGNEFTITSVDDKNIYISIPGNASVNKLTLNLDEIRRMLESEKKFEKVMDITTFFGKTNATQNYSYDFIIYKEILKRKKKMSKSTVKVEELKKYIFIIDEINRGEISKIFGELFFSIDPGYRGENGAVSTQYANLHDNPDEKFYIPENVYIIGTMNDIDRSVDSFDFAMRRRFRFVEIKADENLEMLDVLGEELKGMAVERMSRLNKEIANTEDLNENYQIGAAYFLKLRELDFDELWEDYLEPLLQEYVRGMSDEKLFMTQFAEAYGYEGGKDNNHDN